MISGNAAQRLEGTNLKRSINLTAVLCVGIVELQTSLVAQLEVDVPTTAIFDFPTIESLAQYISNQMCLQKGGSLTAGERVSVSWACI